MVILDFLAFGGGASCRRHRGKGENGFSSNALQIILCQAIACSTPNAVRFVSSKSSQLDTEVAMADAETEAQGPCAKSPLFVSGLVFLSLVEDGTQHAAFPHGSLRRGTTLRREEGTHGIECNPKGEGRERGRGITGFVGCG